MRNHLPVPLVTKEEADSYTLEIASPTLEDPVSFSMKHLKSKFRRIDVTATVQCAGNRRSEFSEAGLEVQGGAWERGAISNAVWTGVRLTVRNSIYSRMY